MRDWTHGSACTPESTGLVARACSMTPAQRVRVPASRCASVPERTRCPRAGPAGSRHVPRSSCAPDLVNVIAHTECAGAPLVRKIYAILCCSVNVLPLPWGCVTCSRNRVFASGHSPASSWAARTGPANIINGLSMSDCIADNCSAFAARPSCVAAAGCSGSLAAATATRAGLPAGVALCPCDTSAG